MPILTKGHVSVRPLSLMSSSSLDEISEALMSQSGAVGKEGGWGSLGDDTEDLGVYGIRSIDVGKPQISDAAGVLPRRLMARRYWWQVDRAALRFVGSNDRDNALRLSACDVIISEFPSADDTYLVLASSRDPNLLATYLRDPVMAIFDSAGLPPSSLGIDQSLFGDFEPDFYLWLMYKFHNSPELTGDITITYLRDLSGLDGSDRATRLKNGVSLDRAELLAMIMGGLTSFGPASFEVEDKGIELYGALHLFPDGSFSPLVGASSYEHTDSSDPRPLGVRLAEDFAYKVLPELRAAHQADAEWAGTLRDQYVRTAGQMLSRVLSSLLTRDQA